MSTNKTRQPKFGFVMKKLNLAKLLADAALRYPGANEDVACAGTALEKRSFKAKDKAFLFLGTKDAMLKLGESLSEADALSAGDPQACKVGAHGWVTITLACAQQLSKEQLLRWLEESYRLVAPKKLVAQLNP